MEKKCNYKSSFLKESEKSTMLFFQNSKKVIYLEVKNKLYEPKFFI